MKYMNRLLIFLITVLFASPALAAGPFTSKELNDLYFGETLYHAYQGEWFDAITRVDTELKLIYSLDKPDIAPLYGHIGRLKLKVSDFEFAYRMHQHDGRAVKTTIEGNVGASVRNGAIYRLARIYSRKGQPVIAMQTLDRIRGEIPARLDDELPFLRARVLIDNDRFDEAVTILSGLQEVKSLTGFAQFNLGIALIRDGKEQQGRQWLDRAGQIDANDPVTAAIRDKANLFLGEKLLNEKDYEAAKQAYNRVRLAGPFSNRALLGSGWADADRDHFDLALAPWSLLAKGEITDSAVQEAMLAVPYAYAKLGIYSNAALLYGQALEVFSAETTKLDTSIKSIEKGTFLAALMRAELRQDADWVVNLRALPEAPETYYLIDLMASHDFQQSLKNYLDLDELRRKLERWQNDLEAFAEIIALRRAYYEPLLPEIDRVFQNLNVHRRLRRKQRDRVRVQMKTMLVTPRPDALVTAGERITRERLARLEQILTVEGRASDPVAAARLKRLRGLLVWAVQTGYNQRFNETRSHLHALNQEIDLLAQQYTSFVRTRKSAIQSYQGYDETIRLQQVQVEESLSKVRELMDEQGSRIEIMAINELSWRRDRLEELQVEARFAMADSYDRASQTKKRKGGQP
jgi:tetratricopeptide (TPR) repeat protein